MEIIRRTYHLYSPDLPLFNETGLHARIIPYLFHSASEVRAEAVATLSCFLAIIYLYRNVSASPLSIFELVSLFFN